MNEPLTDGQGREVLRLAGLARWIAHRVWRASSLPARYLEELASDAVVFLCDIVLRYDRYPDKSSVWTLDKVVSYQLWRMLRGRASRYKKVRLLPNEEIVLFAPEMDDSREDVILDAVLRLSEPQRETIERRFGLDGLGERSQRQVARELDTTQSNVCRAESRAIRTLQQWLRENGCDS